MADALGLAELKEALTTTLGEWIDLDSDGSEVRLPELADQLAVPWTTLRAMLDDGTLALISPTVSVKWFGEGHRNWRLYWRRLPPSAPGEPDR